MASEKPIVRQANWLAYLPQILLVIILIVAFRIVDSEKGYLLGAATYVLIAYGLKYSVGAAHRKGVSLFKKGKYEEAIIVFRKSLEFFRYCLINSFKRVLQGFYVLKGHS